MGGFPEGAQCGDDDCGGIVTFRAGTKYYSVFVGPDEDGEIVVRIENGVYRGYTRDGRRCRLIDKHWVDTNGPPSDVDIVEFIKCGFDDPRAAGLPTETVP